MAYSVVTATDFADLCVELELFAEAQGWTVPWNSGTQMGLNSGNCYAAFGTDGTTNPATETDTYPTPDVNVQDFRAYGSLGKNFAVSGQFWGLTGSPVTAQVDGDRVYLNDLLGPFSEVHFFGDSTYIWVVIRSDADRWTHFGFGVVDKLGMTHPDCAFFCGIWHRWWDNQVFQAYPIKANLTYVGNDTANKLWMKNGFSNLHIYVPDGVLDPSYLADDFIRYNGMMNLPQIAARGRPPGGYDDFSNAKLLDHWTFASQKPVSGGLPLLTVPVMVGDGSTNSTLTTFLGDLPGIRLCDINNIPIGEDITYGTETWRAFPVKRRTSDSYDGKASSYNLGVAFKKD